MTESVDSISPVVYDSVALSPTTIVIEDNWKSGLDAPAKHTSIENNSGILLLIVLLFLLISLNFKECKKLFSHYFEELRSNKKRENAFDEHTNNQTRLGLLTVIQFIVYSGIVLYEIAVHKAGSFNGSSDNFIKLIEVIGLFACYYCFQLAAYATVGYTFAGKEETVRWLRAFNASQSLAGLFLLLPSLLILFYPSSYGAMSLLAIIIYFCFRLSFIIKGFSIFYDNIFSLIYFILYLCTLEILPLTFLYDAALHIA